jgi:hypothetical protein
MTENMPEPKILAFYLSRKSDLTVRLEEKILQKSTQNG